MSELNSGRTVARRWKELGMKASKATEESIPHGRIVQLVADQMSMDPSRRIGQTTLKQQLALRTGIHLKRYGEYYISIFKADLHVYRRTIGQIQKLLDNEAVVARSPNFRQIKRVPLTSQGPNEVWCCDGHDKLMKYGFAIWGVRDKFSRRWMGLWVLPNNRIGIVVAYLWLTLVRDLEGRYSMLPAVFSSRFD
jgi:hypothetical protein